MLADNNYLQFARKLTRKILFLHRKHIFAIGLFGSLANPMLKSYSDIDFIIISEKHIRDKFFIVTKSKGRRIYPKIKTEVKVSLFFRTKKEATKQALDISGLSWPTEAAMVLNVLPLYDPSDFFSGLVNKYGIMKKIHAKGFNQLATRWLSVAYEFLVKINQANTNKTQLKICAIEFLFCIANFIKASNSDFFKNRYNFFEEIKQVPLKPEYSSSMQTILNLYHHKEICREINKLWDSAINFSRDHRIRIPIYSQNQFNTKIKNLFYD